MSLKALALLALSRDSGWDGTRDKDAKVVPGLSHGAGTSGTARGTAVVVHVIPCAACGALSRPFGEVVNSDGWQCRTCLPSPRPGGAHVPAEVVRLADVRAARAYVLTGFYDDPEIAAERALVRDVDG